MAPLPRPTWTALKAEVLRRLGGRSEPSIGARVEAWLDAAQLDLALTFHHFELDTTAALELSAGNSTVDLPTDCYIVLGIALMTPREETFRRWLTLQHLRYVQANFSIAGAEPAEYARFGSALLFNCPADRNYPILVRYYRFPSPPDFAGAMSPELSRLWDEHLIEGALAKAHGALWRPDLAAAHGQMLQEFLSTQVQPALLAELLPDRSTTPTANRTHGGAQG